MINWNEHTQPNGQRAWLASAGKIELVILEIGIEGGAEAPTYSCESYIKRAGISLVSQSAESLTRAKEFLEDWVASRPGE
ncbi:MAG: hypothetical protein K1X53_09900 [Candidatus Sumerlaeaceae bacterium]|nr:hypothetical protein [Candidatus Sumerlaeaceae bacterium]